MTSLSRGRLLTFFLSLFVLLALVATGVGTRPRAVDIRIVPSSLDGSGR